jgi:hypothetical protein
MVDYLDFRTAEMPKSQKDQKKSIIPDSGPYAKAFLQKHYGLSLNSKKIIPPSSAFVSLSFGCHLWTLYSFLAGKEMEELRKVDSNLCTTDYEITQISHYGLY